MKVLIPKKAMDEVEKLSSAAGSDAQIEFAKDESHLFFQAGHRLLISRILTGQFPNYEAVLPRDNYKTVVIERGELMRRRPPRIATRRPALSRRQTRRLQRRHRNFRFQSRIRRSQGKYRKGIFRRSHRHRFQFHLHARLPRRRRRWPHQHRAQGRTIRRPDAPPRR